MNAKTIILLTVLGLVAFLLYYFSRKENSTITVDEKNTTTSTGLSALLNTTGGSNVLSNLFNTNKYNTTTTTQAPTPATPTPTVGIGGNPINAGNIA